MPLRPCRAWHALCCLLQSLQHLPLSLYVQLHQEWAASNLKHCSHEPISAPEHRLREEASEDNPDEEQGSTRQKQEQASCLQPVAERRFLWSLGKTQYNTNDLFGIALTLSKMAPTPHIEYLFLVKLRYFEKYLTKITPVIFFLISCIRIVRRNKEKSL